MSALTETLKAAAARLTQTPRTDQDLLLAVLLEEIARQFDAPACDAPDGVCNGCESRPDFVFAESLAGAILDEFKRGGDRD